MDNFTACELAYRHGYETGLKAQYGETVGALIRERDYYASKARYYEGQLRKKEQEDVQV